MTQADRTARLIQHARTRHEQTLERARAALAALAASGGTVTITALSGNAGVSRSWIYAQPELRDQIEQLRSGLPRTGLSDRQAGSQASAESLRRRLALAHQRIQQLRDENRQLQQSLARAHGQRRAATTSQHSL